MQGKNIDSSYQLVYYWTSKGDDYEKNCIFNCRIINSFVHASALRTAKQQHE